MQHTLLMKLVYTSVQQGGPMEEERFPVDRLRLSRIYTGREWESLPETLLSCPKVEEIYGPLKFPAVHPDRCYTFGSFVMSIDGRIAFPASPDGTLIAKSNRNDPDGGLCDYWILNLLRAASDAVIMGSLTIKREPRLTGRIFDPALLEQRCVEGRMPVPLHVILSRSGANLPLDHRIYADDTIPVVTVLSPSGAAALKKRDPDRFIPFSGGREELSHYLGGEKEGLWHRSLLLPAGEGDQLLSSEVVRLLAGAGIRRALVESPTFLASLLASGDLDELFLNTSGIFVGGKALTIGEQLGSFTPESHPHARVLTMHAHSDAFFYTRYRFSD